MITQKKRKENQPLIIHLLIDRNRMNKLVPIKSPAPVVTAIAEKSIDAKDITLS